MRFEWAVAGIFINVIRLQPSGGKAAVSLPGPSPTQSTRRSTRHRRSPDDIDVRVSSSDSLRDLKIKVIGSSRSLLIGRFWIYLKVIGSLPQLAAFDWSNSLKGDWLNTSILGFWSVGSELPIRWIWLITKISVFFWLVRAEFTTRLPFGSGVIRLLRFCLQFIGLHNEEVYYWSTMSRASLWLVVTVDERSPSCSVWSAFISGLRAANGRAGHSVHPGCNARLRAPTEGK